MGAVRDRRPRTGYGGQAALLPVRSRARVPGHYPRERWASAAPICPILAAGGLYAFIVPSPKRTDLRRDGRYALHCYPPEELDDEFCVMGRATEVTDPAVRAQVAAAYHHPVQEQWILFAFDVERCLHAKYRYRGDWPPTYTKWIEQSLREG